MNQMLDSNYYLLNIKQCTNLEFKFRSEFVSEINDLSLLLNPNNNILFIQLYYIVPSLLVWLGNIFVLEE